MKTVGIVIISMAVMTTACNSGKSGAEAERLFENQPIRIELADAMLSCNGSTLTFGDKLEKWTTGMGGDSLMSYKGMSVFPISEGDIFCGLRVVFATQERKTWSSMRLITNEDYDDCDELSLGSDAQVEMMLGGFADKKGVKQRVYEEIERQGFSKLLVNSPTGLKSMTFIPEYDTNTPDWYPEADAGLIKLNGVFLNQHTTISMLNRSLQEQDAPVFVSSVEVERGRGSVALRYQRYYKMTEVYVTVQPEGGKITDVEWIRGAE